VVGMGRIIIRIALQTTRKGRIAGSIVFCAAGLGSVILVTYALPSVIPLRQAIGPTISGFVVPSNLSRSHASGCGELPLCPFTPFRLPLLAVRPQKERGGVRFSFDHL
jgi:hypothetical protein